MTELFETPQLGALARKLAEQKAVPAAAQPVKPRDVHPKVSDRDIAIVGLSGRFPQSRTLAEFWESLCQGRDLISRFDPSEMEDAVSPQDRSKANYRTARPVLDDVDMFDARYFGILPKEAALMDPQARVFLEICVHALEDAGLDPMRAKEAIGVFAGASYSTYMLANILTDSAALADFTSQFQLGNYAAFTGNIADSLATRVAYKLDLKGPAISMGTACSTSLTAIAQACGSLRAGQSDVALAGGVSITFPQKRGYFSQEGGMASEDGTCRPFDAAANGTVFGHGAGVVVLKRLPDALASGDRIYATIRGVGLNNDGADKIAYTAPSVNGQAEAIRRAHRDAGIDAGSVSYVECHGTATPLGDPIEIRGLSSAFGPQEADRCALGSVKGNIGHLDAAAGVAGVIKTALMLHHKKILPVAHFTSPNPDIDFEGSPFFVPAGLQDWACEGPRRAGISSFGIGGTNAHLVLEEAPEALAQPDVTAPQILPLSAKTPEALADMAGNLADALEQAGAPALADAAFTLQEGRSRFDYRTAVVARTAAEAATALRKLAPVKTPTPADAPAVLFMFAGQGSQYPGMGRGLYEAEPEFARWINQGAEILQPLLGLDINEILCLGDVSDEVAARALRDTRLTQPALFLIQYANARLWQSRGVQPTAMIGHSVGEFAAAAISGVFDFETGLRMIAKRGQLMQDQPSGAMLSVRAALDELTPFLNGDVDLAAQNAPKLQVVAGPDNAIDALKERLDGAGLASSRLHTSHAFHSAMMAPVSEALSQEFAAFNLNEPQIPYVSCVTGEWITPEQAVDPSYWATQARACVNFQAGIRTATQDKSAVLLEVGAGRTLSAFAAQTLERGSHGGIIQSLSDHTQTSDDEITMAAAFSKLWGAGVPVDWARAGARGNRRVSLPGYAFQRKRHWVSPEPAQTRTAPQPRTAQPAALPCETVKSDPVMTMNANVSSVPRTERFCGELLTLLSDLSGEDLGPDDVDVTYLELGFDSLFLGQVSQALLQKYDVTLTFRSLLTEYPTIAELAGKLDEILPADAPEPVEPAAVEEAPAAVVAPAPVVDVMPVTAVSASPLAGDAAGVMQAQMQTMQAVFAQQLQALGGGSSTPQQAAAPAPVPVTQTPSAPQDAPVPQAAPEAADVPVAAKPAAFKVGRGPNLAAAELTPEQQVFARDLASRYSAKFPKSKALAQKYRHVHADPRTVSGFHPQWKELAFPVVADRAKGAHLWDIDGNTFIDLVNGFGQTAFGHSPEFVTRAVQAQMERGYPIGPQSEIAGAVAERFARMVEHERVTFCNTGSEAVMSAMRLARSVTGRDKVVVFGNDYHGQFDEVLIKGKSRGGAPAALPLASGIPRTSLSNMVVLPYGEETSLDWIKENAKEIAAVIIEPIQSRHPEVQPVEFVRSLRKLTKDIDAALVFDEVVTGFRTHAKGVQGEWGIQGDMATYGKVVGGGMPVGVLAGDGRFLDALDGGFWTYGDDSKPEVAPTYVAGTFVRHPLVLAAIDATLEHMENHGDRLWKDTAARAIALRKRMNAFLVSRGLPELVTGHSSWIVPNVTGFDARASLLYPLMRYDGVHLMDGFCGFLTTEHGDAEVNAVAESFERAVRTLQEQGILLGEGEITEQPTPPSARDDAESTFPLTEGQREIWMTSQLGDAASLCFNEGAVVKLSGPLDVAALNRALDRIVARHDALRAVFDATGSHFTVQPAYHLEVEQITAPDGTFDTVLDRIADEAARYVFDLTTQPALRARLVTNGQDRHGLVLNAHHIICDGWSYNIIFEELAAFYRAETGGQAGDLPTPVSFAAHARREQQGTARPETRAFWAAQYRDIPALPELPHDHPRPQRRSYRGATLTRFIPADVMVAARKAGAKQGCTLFSTLFAAVQVTLGRLSGCNDVVIGVPTGGQAQLANPHMIGHAVNFLPVRAAFDPAEPVSAHLNRVSGAVMDAFEHQDYTFGTLVQDLNVPRALNRLPLTEIQFNLETLPEDLDMGAVSVKLAPNRKAASNFDMFFNVVESRDGLRVDVDYNSEVYRDSTIDRWVGHLEQVLRSLAADPTRAVQDLDLTATGHSGSVEQEYAGYDRSAMIQTLVDRTVASTPDAIALEDDRRQLTYRALQDESDALAAHIQAQVTGAGQRIGLLMDRSVNMVVALLAILKAGHTYLPLDPTQPEARLKLILETARAAAVLTDAPARLSYVQQTGAVLVDVSKACAGTTPAPVAHDPEDSAYIIFTSGTTGTPKGVEIPHRAVVNFLNSMAQKPGLTAQDTLLSVTTVMFDIAVLELFLPLAVGAKCVIASKEQVLDGFALVDRLEQGDITVMQATPTLWDMVLDAGFAPKAGMKLLAGGEPLPRDLAARLMAQGAELWNMYGPTETTIWSAVAKVAADEPITIGHAIANTDLLILDTNDMPVPVGVTGELNIGGDGLAKGYLDRPDLTGKAFRTVTVKGTPQRLYRTGDLARQNADGTIEVLGRIDTQVKLRGFRIELGEIESRLRALDGVHKAAVDVKTRASGDRQLVAYIVAGNGAALEASEMRHALGAVLPNYMVPQAYVMLEALPQTANGKLDRKALPEPDNGPQILEEAAAPSGSLAKTPTEEKIREIWVNVLGQKEISTTDTLFDLGVDSLMVFRIAARLAEAGLNLQAKHLLDHPSITQLAAFADSRVGADVPKVAAAPSLKDFRNGARRGVGIVQ
ncbi:MAG: amino acid adenylation domain-containing protein [Rhodobacteraceae bacterium]|nr:amino acid adenylation domain-containing protein [Paracoccaceae bacterium]